MSDMYLNEDNRQMIDWQNVKSKYILYSNICNDMKNHISFEGMEEIKRFEKNGICVILYINKK
jgi:hypothetical protein